MPTPPTPKRTPNPIPSISTPTPIQLPLFVGVDVGTTSTKALVVDTRGNVISMAAQGYTLQVPYPGWAEQEPDAIFAAVVKTVRQAVQQANVASSAIAALGFSTAMHSLIAVDEHHQPLTPCLTWADTRSAEQAAQLKQTNAAITLYHHTGTPIHPMSPLTKLLWFHQHQPETLAKAAKWISIKEYILHRLCGAYVVDYATASASGLLHVEERTWDAIALDVAGIHRQQLSEVVAPTHRLIGLQPDLARVMGLCCDMPIVVGSSDGACANIGVGAIAPNTISVTIGTSGAVRQLRPTPIFDANGRTFCYAVTDHQWLVGGATNNGGLALRWFGDRFCEPEQIQAQQQNLSVYPLIMALAEQAPAGANGLIFLPFLTGERAPHWNADARAVLFGLAYHHRRHHVARAVLEGILFSVYDVVSILVDDAERSPQIWASGGFAQSSLWRQMMADVFGYEVIIPEVYEASGLGAAQLAMLAVGAIANLEDGRSPQNHAHRHRPTPEAMLIYQTLHPIYRRLYANLVEEFSAIAQFQRTVG
ncbi:gluconokinase [Leptolyngbya sp. AN02str]|uniref:gluconokinase n=1 Tax=Leptolyngbya sp. AN02str TaxID=3423363 RepID=UPI003D320869